MVSNALLHPEHIVPASEFAAALVEFSCDGKSEMQVKIGTVRRQKFVVFFRRSDAGIKIANAHFLQPAFQFLVKHSSESAFCCSGIQVDGGFTRPVVGGSSDKFPGVGKTLNRIAFLDDQIRVTSLGDFHPFLKFFDGGHFVFKGDGRSFYVVGVYFPKASGIEKLGVTDRGLIYGSAFPMACIWSG